MVNNIIAATGLDSFYLKNGEKFISETFISEPSPFPNSQNLLDSIYEIPKIKRPYVESKKYFSLKARFPTLKSKIFGLKSQIELPTKKENLIPM